MDQLLKVQKLLGYNLPILKGYIYIEQTRFIPSFFLLQSSSHIRPKRTLGSRAEPREEVLPCLMTNELPSRQKRLITKKDKLNENHKPSPPEKKTIPFNRNEPKQKFSSVSHPLSAPQAQVGSDRAANRSRFWPGARRGHKAWWVG